MLYHRLPFRDRSVWINATVCICLILQLGISYKLWLPFERDFPMIPAITSIPLELGLAVDTILVIIIIGALAALVLFPFGRLLTIAFIAAAILLVMEDITRLQPWLYLFGMMFLIFALRNPRIRQGESSCLAILLLSSLYFWSGLQKLNHAFTVEIAPWLASAFGLGALIENRSELAYIAPVVEMGIGVMLLTRSLRRWGGIAGIAMHLLVTLAIGPLGGNWNGVIWPWNVAMAVILLLVAFPQSDEEADATLASSTKLTAGPAPLLRSPLLYALILLAWILPALNYAGLWDSHLSGSLYSGNNSEAIFYFPHGSRGSLPPAARDFIYFSHSLGSEFVLLDHWALAELQVPFYPERRYFLELGRRLCDCVGDTAGAGLAITVKERFTSRQHLERYPCRELRSGR